VDHPPARRGVARPARPRHSSFFAVFLYITLYLQQILGLSAIEAAWSTCPARS